MDQFVFTPIASVVNSRDHLNDDDWGEVVSQIHLGEGYSADLFMGLDTFSHVEIIFVFHRIPGDKNVPDTRHPRSNMDWPRLGLLAQRSAYHPNSIGLSRAEIISVEGSTLTVKGLDAVNGTPVLDIKPFFREFIPSDTQQPPWVSELLKEYWKKS